MTVENIREYVQVRTPDKAALANCVNRAKGPERTMAQFADDCQISASTLSRIVNCKITNPLSVDIIIKIFENRAAEEDEYLLDALARANGLHPKDYAERVNARNSYAHKRNEEMGRANMMKNIIVAEVVDRGLLVERVNDMRVVRPGAEAPAIYPRRRIDFSLALKSEQGTPDVKTWSFFLYPYVPNKEAEQSVARDPKYIISNLLDKVSRWFLMDAWYPASLSNMKTSFVFADSELFDGFVEALRKAKLNSEMTIILIDMDSYSVKEEIWIPGNYKRLTEESIFKAPKPGFRDGDYGFGDFDEAEDFEE